MLHYWSGWIVLQDNFYDKSFVNREFVQIFKSLFRIKCGEMEFYNKSFDRINTKLEKRLARVNRLFHKVTTTDDPNIRKVFKQV